MDQFADHARLLKGERVDLDAEVPASGWYRTRRVKNGPFLPVQVMRWGDFDAVVILLDGKPATAQDIGWPYTGKNAISGEMYENYILTRRWSDVDEAVRGSGDNQPPADEAMTPEAEMQAKVDAALAGLSAYASWNENRIPTLTSSLQDGKVQSLIADDDALTRAQTLRSRLLELSGDADKLRKTEKEPHKKAADAVDARWQPIVKIAQTGADALRRVMGAWETVKLNRQLAEKAEADKREAAEREGAEAKGITPLPSVAPTMPAPTAPRRIKGGSGRAASVATVTVVDAVTDWAALAAYFRDREDVRALLLRLANEELRANNQVPPGVTTRLARDVK